MVPNNIVLASAVVPLREPAAVDLRARLRPDVMPSEVQELLDEEHPHAGAPEPHIGLEEIDADEVVVRIAATPGAEPTARASRTRSSRRSRRSRARARPRSDGPPAAARGARPDPGAAAGRQRERPAASASDAEQRRRAPARPSALTTAAGRRAAHHAGDATRQR